MGFFKRLFRKKEVEKKEDSWYNDLHEKSFEKGGFMTDSFAGAAPNMAILEADKKNTAKSR